MRRLTSLLSGQNKLSSASLILVVTLTLSNILGWVRLHYLAQKIPAGTLDTYVAAFRLPDVVFNLIVLGAISSAFIPIFADYLERKREHEAWHVAQSILTLLVIAVAAILVVLYFALPYLIPYLVPHFDADKQNMALELSRIFLLSPLIFSVSYLVGGILNSFNRFVAYALAPLLYNLSIIFGTIFLADRYSVYGVAWAVVAGALLHLLVQLWPALKLGLKLRPVLDIGHYAVRKVGLLMVPRILGMAANQIMLVVFTAVASLTSGANFIFDSMNNIQTMPTVVFGTSFATAVFPLLSRHAALTRRDLFVNDVLAMSRKIIFLLLPASAGLILLRAQIVRLVMGSGYFGWAETITAASTLGLFAVSLVFSGMIPLLARSFYALKDTLTPMLLSSAAAGLSIVAAIAAYKMRLDIAPALAAAFSIGAVINALLLYVALDRRLKGTLNGTLVSYTGRVALATVVMVVAVQGVKYWIGTIFDLDRAVWLALQTGAAVGIGLVVYWGVALLLKIPEASSVSQFIGQFIWKKSATSLSSPT